MHFLNNISVRVRVVTNLDIKSKYQFA